MNDNPLNLFDQKTGLESIKGGLTILDKVFNKQKINYRVLGSLLVAALNGQPHRKLNDIDILLDENQADQVLSSLKNEGYKIELKHKFGFGWVEAHHPHSLGFTFLLIGKLEEGYFTYRLSKYLQLKIDKDYLKPTTYSLFGVKFAGIPQRSIYEGLRISSLNPKRTLDRKVVEKTFGPSLPVGQSLDKAFKIYLFGREIPHAYSFFSSIYNLYGGMRVKLGKKYEIWE